MIDADLTALETHINTSNASPGDILVLVHNCPGWPRRDYAEVNVGFSEPGTTAVRLLDGSGREVPVQFVSEQRYGGGGLRNARIVSIARDVPTMVYVVYQVVPDKGAPSRERLRRVPQASPLWWWFPPGTLTWAPSRTSTNAPH